MKIRTKITFWISGTALLSTLVFSSIIFFKLMEQPFKFIDKELEHMTQALIDQMSTAGQRTGRYEFSLMPYNPDQYWIKVTDNSSRILYQSNLTKYTDIPPLGEKTIYMIERIIPRSRIWLSQDHEDDVLFRVLVTRTAINNFPITIRIAKPIERFEEDLLSLARFIIISLLVCTLAIVLLSYTLAGKILNPIRSIIDLSKIITEKSLEKRIPLNRNKDELYHLALSLNKMFDRLQYSFQRQKEFIGNASHELKSPMTLLMLAQEDLFTNENLPPAVSSELEKQLDITRRMSHLVKNLLDLSRLEQQETLARKQVDIGVLIHQVLDDYAELLTAKQIRVRTIVGKTLVLQGDPEKLLRLFINIVDNSIRYNLETNGTITLTGRKTGQGIRIEAANTGRQIPEDELELVFEQFYRVEKSRSVNHGGSGLGLAIARKIVDLHCGTIQICNGNNNDIITTVFLPLIS